MVESIVIRRRGSQIVSLRRTASTATGRSRAWALEVVSTMTALVRSLIDMEASNIWMNDGSWYLAIMNENAADVASARMWGTLACFSSLTPIVWCGIEID